MSVKETAKLHMQLNVCMLGARGVGKTTVLTAIFDETNGSKGLSSTSKIVFSPKDETRQILSKRKKELLGVFDEKKVFSNAGIKATSGASPYYFEFGMLGKTPCVDLNITDFPGEFLYTDKEFVNKSLAESSAIMIAIDTPYLMEDNGKYNDAKNQISLIYEYLKENLKEVTESKLIMFVPLKCEKYFYNGEMQLVNDQIRKHYAGIIDLYKSNDKVGMVITPILTLGDVEFSHFSSGVEFPIANYKFRGDSPKFAPRFCTQPIYYLLSFVVNRYNENKNSVGFLGKILQAFFEFFKKNEDLCGEMFLLNQFRLEDDSLGFSIVSNKKLMNTK